MSRKRKEMTSRELEKLQRENQFRAKATINRWFWVIDASTSKLNFTRDNINWDDLSHNAKVMRDLVINKKLDVLSNKTFCGSRFKWVWM